MRHSYRGKEVKKGESWSQAMVGGGTCSLFSLADALDGIVEDAHDA